MSPHNLNRLARDCFQTAILVCLIAPTCLAVTGDPAWPGNHPLTQPQAGELLVAQLRCAACHSGIQRDTRLEKSAPELTDVGSRIAPEYMQRYLAAPWETHPGTTMPDVLASRPLQERQQIAEALTHFLIVQSKRRFAPNQASQPSNIELGKSLFHSVGCIACHGPKEPPPESATGSKPIDDDLDDPDAKVIEKSKTRAVSVGLGHVPSKYSLNSLSDFLFQPLRVRGSGRMPDMKLNPAESLAIASYLIGSSAQAVSAFEPKQELVARGRQYFQELNCAACHTLDGMPSPRPTIPLNADDLAVGCLAKESARSPRYQLEEAQIQAIAASLRATPTKNSEPESDSAVVAKTLTAFNCIACHVRDDYGGVHEERSPYFTTSEKNLGEDGRIPPPLTLAGAKLRPAWLKKVLFDGESVRPYMATRMPQYGPANLDHLPGLLARTDVLESIAMNIPSPEGRSEREREREKTLRKAGQELLGDKGLSCINCHNFNGKPAPYNKGIDLMTTFERLQPGWFNRFSRNPGAFRPRIVMPASWPDGIAVHKGILDGNTDMQIEAIWYYLSLGTSAAEPSGIRRVNTRLSVDQKAVTYRGRSRVAGFRGIAVGLPQKLNYAFNAETGTLSAIWLGDFISVNWNGQGSGDFSPAAESIALAQDVSFAPLVDADAAWPLMPVMTKEARTNPNPLYPKNLGYQFRGYVLDDARVPTFMYRSGSIDIEDRSEAIEEAGQLRLKRVLQLNSPSPQILWFRALTGNVDQESPSVFRSGQMRLMLPAVESKIRAITDQPERRELLLRLPLPEGKFTLELRYEPDPK